VVVSTDVSAQALPVTEFIHGKPEPVVVGPLQPLPFLTVNELVPLDQSMPPDSSFLCLSSNDDASPILPPLAEKLENTLLFNPSLNLATLTDSHSCSDDVASAASSQPEPKRPPYQIGKPDPPPPPRGYWRRIGGMHYCLQLGFVNTLIHEKGPGECPKCHEIGPCWYLCSQCADDGYLCIPPQWTVGQAGVLTNPTSIANIAHLLANYLKVQASPEVREKSRQHFDFLLNICRPKVAPWLPLLLFSYQSHQRLDFV
jgi:hypothetical protein